MKKQLINQMIQAQFRTSTKGSAFMPEIGDNFRNKAHSNICFADGDGEEDKPFMSFSSQEELDAYIAKNSGKKDDDESLFEKRRKEEQQKRDGETQVKTMQSAIKFDTVFDDFIEKNKSYFPESVKTIRGDVKSDDAVDRANLMAATAAKEYFSIPANLESLNAADRERVKREIMDVRFEQQIKGLEVWELVERSLYGHELMDKHKKANDFMGKDGTGKTGYANVDNYLDKFFPKSVQAVSN